MLFFVYFKAKMLLEIEVGKAIFFQHGSPLVLFTTCSLTNVSWGFSFSSRWSWYNFAKNTSQVFPVGLNSETTVYPFHGNLSLNNHNGGKAQAIKLCHVMRSSSSRGVESPSYPGSSRKGTESLPDCLIIIYFVPNWEAREWENLIWKMY